MCSHQLQTHADLLKKYEAEKLTEVKLHQKARKRKLEEGQTTLIGTIQKDPQKSITREEKLILDFIVKGMHPLSTIEEDGFKKMIIGNFLTCTIFKKRLENESH